LSLLRARQDAVSVRSVSQLAIRRKRVNPDDGRHRKRAIDMRVEFVTTFEVFLDDP